MMAGALWFAAALARSKAYRDSASLAVNQKFDKGECLSGAM